MNKCKILLTEFVTHDVRRFILEKPSNYKFTPGQATEVSINKPGWEDQKRPFTFTSLNDDDALEFIIKCYDPKINPDHEGMTFKLHDLVPGDELLIDEPWGTIEYKEPGTFIAGGAGITPFIAIFRQLKKDGKVNGNKLIFSNKEAKDIILEKELKNIFDTEELILTLTNENNPEYHTEKVDKPFLDKNIKDFKQKFYVCGPPNMVKEISGILKEMGTDPESIVFEK